MSIFFERIVADREPELFEEYCSLARATFKYASEDLSVLLDEDTVLVAAMTDQSGQRILAGGLYAWRDNTYLKRSGRDLTLSTYEISGAVVRDGHGGRGVYKTLAVLLFTLLAQQPDPIDVAAC